MPRIEPAAQRSRDFARRRARIDPHQRNHMRLTLLVGLSLASPLAAQTPAASAPAARAPAIAAPDLVQRSGEWNIRYDVPATPDSSLTIVAAAPGFLIT